MGLKIGSRLGHYDYDVTALIGEGGMGQVYRDPPRASPLSHVSVVRGQLRGWHKGG